jgi:hypothetical protein
MWVLPVPGPPISTTLSAPSMNSPRCSWRTRASLTSLAGEVEPGQVLVGREPGRLDLVGDGPDLALGHLGLEQLGEDRHGGIEGRRALLDQIADGLGHAIHLEAAQHDDDGSAGGIMTHGAPPQVVIAADIGERLLGKAQGLRRVDR